jgi:hypothetical protein
VDKWLSTYNTQTTLVRIQQNGWYNRIQKIKENHRKRAQEKLKREKEYEIELEQKKKTEEEKQLNEKLKAQQYEQEQQVRDANNWRLEQQRVYDRWLVEPHKKPSDDKCNEMEMTWRMNTYKGRSNNRDYLNLYYRIEPTGEYCLLCARPRVNCVVIKCRHRAHDYCIHKYKFNDNLGDCHICDTNSLLGEK